ncbi:hypothetical protein F5884DRAFT_877388 [Xylogone sp. PMI_703]|nr:hypothetical protein F5884DRAFT_877388 [Xylogone sp. PMI_703]
MPYFHHQQHSASVLSQRPKAERSQSWVMTSPTDTGFVKLPHERILYRSPQRTSLEVSSANQYPGNEPFNIKSDTGVVYLTNQRIVYLPATPTPELQSFSSPIMNLQDSFVRAPFFGANYWSATCRPVAGGGIPPSHALVNIKMTFREGGAFDFHTLFEQIKEKVLQAYSVAQELGTTRNLNLADVDLENLPAYEPAPANGANIVPGSVPRTAAHSAPVTPRNEEPPELDHTDDSSREHFTAPDEPPPGYEEAQIQAVGISLDERLREEAERQSP